jgi:hypothetical protein
MMVWTILSDAQDSDGVSIRFNYDPELCKLLHQANAAVRSFAKSINDALTEVCDIDVDKDWKPGPAIRREIATLPTPENGQTR